MSAIENWYGVRQEILLLDQKKGKGKEIALHDR